MTPTVMFFVSIALIATLSFLFSNANRFFSAFVVGLAGQTAVAVLVVPEASDMINAAGRMGAVPTLAGLWVVAVICGACMAEGVTSWARKGFMKT